MRCVNIPSHTLTNTCAFVWLLNAKRVIFKAANVFESMWLGIGIRALFVTINYTCEFVPIEKLGPTCEPFIF